jgi:phosphomannomutase
MEKDEEDFYSYRLKNHKALKFGTSGLRDIDEKLTDMQIYISTKGFLNYLKSIPAHKGGVKEGTKIAVAGDFRPTTPRIFLSVGLGIIDSGFLIDYCGRIPTPVVSLWGFYNKIPSIMVTASHNPYGQNGVKFIKPNSEVMKDEEKIILDEINKVREIEYKKSWKESLFDKNGFLKDFSDIYDSYHRFLILKSRISLNDENINHFPSENYIERYKKSFGNILDNEKIVFYEQTSVGREIVPKIFRELGAHIISVGRVDETKEFVPVDTEDMKQHILEKMAMFAVENNSFTAITLDGDSDRPAILFIKRDKEGKPRYKDGKPDYYFIKGDKLNVIACIFLKPHFVAAPISVSHKPMELLKKYGMHVKLTKVGSPHVIKEMSDRYNENSELILYGFEANGGGMLGSKKVFSDNRELHALPTRDPVFPLICLFALAKSKDMHIEELVEEIFSGEFESHTYSGLVENLSGVSVTEGCERYDSDTGKNLIKSFSPNHNEIIEVDYTSDIVCNDYNGNILIIEKNTRDNLIKIRDTVIKYIHDIIGDYSIKIVRINYLDGIKIYLSNSEILHFRPSGNASQFRVYAESNNEERSFEIINRAIKPRTGVIIRLINDYLDGIIKM